MSSRARGRPFKACRRCKSLVPKEATRCPVCGSTDLSNDWEGVIVVIDPEKSELAKKLGITQPGRYALRVR
ncbi:MAG: transcription elongation factor subunit Spt4 [Thermoproteota archaeon]